MLQTPDIIVSKLTTPDWIRTNDLRFRKKTLLFLSGIVTDMVKQGENPQTPVFPA
jgi:hypothetical protein